jgi:hypothetical protein
MRSDNDEDDHVYDQDDDFNREEDNDVGYHHMRVSNLLS